MIDLIIGFIEIGVGVMLIEFNYMFNLGISLLILGGFYIGKRILSRKGKIVMSEEERKAIENLSEYAYAIYDFKLKSKDVKTVLNLIETQNKMIELMAEFMNKRSWKEHQVKDDTCYCCKFEYGSDECKQCIIEYFRNKVKESE